MSAGEAYCRFVEEARRVGWRVALLVEESSKPTVRASRLSSLALRDRTGGNVATASLLHDDDLDLAAAQLRPLIHNRTRRP